MSITYKDSGVDITAAELLVEKIKPFIRQTFNSKVMADIGLFGGFFDAKFDDVSEPVLVSSVDGIGTKIKIACLMNRHDTVGQCLVNHCTNDILACGARPLFFLDYFATGKLDVDIATDVIKGFSIACKENNCALIGGETAEMPSMYAPGDYDVSGTIVGVVDKSKILNGEKIAHGDVLIGLPSTGLHTNGYSLARAVVLEKYKIDDFISELGMSIGEALLAIHRSYLHILYPLIQRNMLNGISHITGGGIEGNIKRLLHNGNRLKVDWNAWEWLPIFKFIQSAGNITDEEMRKVFNLGIGIVLIVDKAKVDNIISQLKEHNPLVIGYVD